jgi:hypothetical protein
VLVNSLGGLNLKSPNFYFFPLFALVISENLIAATWNVDPYHEGALFPTAVGIADGLAPFRGVSQQYGFLGPLLVSLLLRVFGNYLIVERLFGFTLVLAIATVFYFNLRTWATKLNSKFITLLWLSISPIWSWPFGNNALSGGYWPNHLGILMVLLGLLLLQRSKLSAFPAGFLVLLSSQARVEFIFVWIFMTAAIFLKEKERRIYWSAGSSVSIILIYEYLSVNEAVREWFRQTALVWTMSPPDVPKINVNFFLFNAINFFGVAIIGYLLLACAVFLEKKFNNLWIKFLVNLAFILCLLTIPHFIHFQLKFGNYDFIATFKYILANTLFSYINLTMAISLFCVTYLITKHRHLVFEKFASQNSNLLMLFSASIGLLSLFHNFNPDYSQMIWPVFGLLLVAIFSNFQILPLFSTYKVVFPTLVLTLALASSFAFFSHSSHQVHPYETQMLKWLYGNSTAQVKSLDNSFDLIAKNSGKRQLRMICQTGLFSVNKSGFLGSDKWTWNQQPPEMISNRLDHLKVGNTVLACHLNSEDASRIDVLLTQKILEVVDKNPSFTLYRVAKAFG